MGVVIVLRALRQLRDAHPVPPGFLCTIERLICRSHEGFDIRSVPRGNGNADADGDVNAYVIQDEEEGLDFAPNAFGSAFDSRTIGLCQITEELLATVAGGHIGDTDSILDDPPDLSQHMAPHQMAMPVVY